jgi:glutathione S-transferase
MTSPPHLLHFRISHYSEKVRWALDFKGWAHTRESFVPAFHVPGVRGRSGQNQVPVLVLDGETLVGSSRILAELERRRPEPPLFPSDPAERKRALELEAFFDEEVAPDLRRLFWSTYLGHPADTARLAADGASAFTRRAWRAAFPLLRPLLVQNMGLRAEQVHRARERLGGYFDRLESAIGPSGYLVGDRFGIADLSAAALMSPIVRPPQFPYPPPEPLPPELTELRATVAERAGFRWVLDIYERHRGTSSEIVA